MSTEPLPSAVAAFAPAAGEPPLQSHTLRIALTPADLPEDGYNQHVNNARLFAFINQTFQAWSRAMDIRGGIPGEGAMMAHMAYDFLREVSVPGTVSCTLRVRKVGRSSLEQAISLWDVSGKAPVLAGRGHCVLVWVNQGSGKATPWPAQVLAKCWPGTAGLPPDSSDSPKPPDPAPAA